MQKKLHIKKGDTVVVITGESKDQRALVEGVNIISKHTKPDAQNPQGGIVKKEAPVHISNLMLIDPSSGEPTRTGRKYNDNNKLVRYSIKSGEEIK